MAGQLSTGDGGVPNLSQAGAGEAGVEGEVGGRGARDDTHMEGGARAEGGFDAGEAGAGTGGEAVSAGGPAQGGAGGTSGGVSGASSAAGAGAIGGAPAVAGQSGSPAGGNAGASGSSSGRAGSNAGGSNPTGGGAGGLPAGDRAAGEAIVLDDYRCASCHEANFAGNGIYPNLTSHPTSGLGSWTDVQIARAIRTGVNEVGETMCALMPHYPFDDQEIANVIAYLRTIPPDAKKITAVCPGHGR